VRNRIVSVVERTDLVLRGDQDARPAVNIRSAGVPVIFSRNTF
jgi:hypothetical protein